MKSRAIRIFVTIGLGVVLGAILATTSGCKDSLERGLTGPVPASPEELIAELEAEKERIDKRTDLMMERIEAFNASRAPGDREVRFSELFYSDLSPEQRDVLDELLKEEKRPSYRNLLTRIIEDRNQIEQMQQRIQYLEQRLPDDFVIVKKGNSHYNLALDYLEGEGVDPDHAKALVSDLGLQEDLLPGFKVWFNYTEDDDNFMTYVTRGEAGQTPLAVQRAMKRNLVRERDVAMAKAVALEETKAALEADITELQKEIFELEDRRDDLSVQIADLEARNEDLQEKGEKLAADLAFTQNSLYYHAASEQQLAQSGILTRFLKNLKDVKGISYDETVDLREAKSIRFSPEPYGLKAIKAVEVWPEIYREGRDYTVQIDPDGQSATVTINDANMFKKQRILIALKGKS